LIKKLKYLFILLILSVYFLPIKVKADEPINIFVFSSSTCSACQNAEVYFRELEKNNSSVKIYRYEITENQDKIKKAEKVIKKNFIVTPWIIIGNKSFAGWYSGSSPDLIDSAIKYYQNNDYKDVLGIELGITKASDSENDTDTEEEISDIVKVPLLGEINIKDISLPFVSFVLGAIDGFNPCAMWVLLFLITMLIGMKDKKKMWILGITFLVTSTLVYLLFMVSWLKVISYASSVIYMRILIALVALVGGTINVRNYFKAKDKDGCVVVDAKKRKNIFSRVKKLTQEKKFYLAFFGIIALAVTVNMVELACSLGIPVVFMQILSVNNLSGFEQGFYLGLYLLAFMLDDLIIFIISMVTLNVTSVSTKYGKYSHLIGGILMILIGILLVFKPEWLSFNFN
jgi:cytochrome c biogenesis protein CcdA/glutaredoxin